MNLRYRNGQYYIWHSRSEWPPAGKLVAISSILGEKITTKKEAQAFFTSYKKQSRKAALSNVFALDTDRIRISDLEKIFVEGEREDLSKDTLRLDGLALRTLKDTAGDKSVAAVTHQDLVDMKTVLRARNLSPATIAGYFRHLKAAFSFAKKQGALQSMPVFPSVKMPEALPTIITEDHLQAILTYAKSNDYQTWRYLTFALHTGCRIGEAYRLEYKDITYYDHPAPSGIVGRATLTGKGSKQRNVPLLPAAMEAVGKRGWGRVFKQWIPTTTSKKFKACVRAAARKYSEDQQQEFEKYHFHTLRHTAATHMYQKGIQLATVQKILGHTDIKTTQIYAKVLDSFVEDEMGKMLG